MIKGSTDFVIVVDSQENRHPYLFPGESIVRKQLLVDGIRTGDYSILGLERRVTVERKTLTDLYSSLSSKRRERFMKEMWRIQFFTSKALVIEATYDQVINPTTGSYLRKFSRLNSQSVLGTLNKIAVEYGIPVIFAGNRRNGNEWTYKTLVKFFQKKRAGLL